nr:transposase (putative), gypsy type [Tanacetum cinerariifolium]
MPSLNYRRLRFRYLSVLPLSFEVTYASATFPCIGSPNQTIHEMPTGKIGVYTRFFEYANFRLPLSTFLVNVFKHYRIHISQLSVIGAAKVSHFEILCRVHGIVPTVGLFRCFYVNSKNKGRMSFSKRQEMDLLSFIRTADPTKVRIGERQHDKDEPKLLETTIGRVVSLLPVAPVRSSIELEASVDKLFDERGSDVAPTQPKRKKKQKTKVVDAGEPSRPAKKLRDDHRASSRPTVGDSSDHSGVNIAEAEVDYVVRTSVPIITSATTTTPTADPVAIAKRNLLAPMAARQMSLSAKVRMRAEYNIRERRRLNSVVEEKDALLKAKDEEIGILKAQLSEVAALKERNNLLEIKKSGLDVKVADLEASVKVREQEVADLDVVVTSVKLQNNNLVDQVHKLDASSVGLQEKVTAYENCLSQLEKFQDDWMREMNDKFNKLDTDLVKMTLHLEEKFYPHLLTTIFGRRWLLTHGLELAIAKCLNSTEYISTLGAAIGKAVKKGMQDGLSARITHGAEGSVLTDVAAYDPSAEADYLSALQRLQSVNFSLIAELKSNKDASIDTIMNLLHLEDSLAKKLGLTESQPHVDQLMVLIHHSPDQCVVGASALSLLLDVSSSTVRRIKENIAKHRSALRDVFVPLSEPLSITALTGTKSTLNVIPATVDTTTALSVTSVFASLIPHISTDGYEITHAEGEKV